MTKTKEEHDIACALCTIAVAMHNDMGNKLTTTLIAHAAAASSSGCAPRKRSGQYRRGGAVPRLKKSVWDETQQPIGR